MKITLKLFASLAEYLPPGGKDNRVEMDVADGTSVADLVRETGVPEARTHLVLINGVFVPREERAGKVLQDGDEVAIWPPVAGG